jgi:hypothetical protein
MAEDLATNIADAAKGPQSVSVDGRTVANRPINDLITADQYLATKAASKNRKRGIRYARAQMPGGV